MGYKSIPDRGEDNSQLSVLLHRKPHVYIHTYYNHLLSSYQEVDDFTVIKIRNMYIEIKTVRLLSSVPHKHIMHVY